MKLNHRALPPLRRPWLARLLGLTGLIVVAGGGWWLHAANTADPRAGEGRTLVVMTGTLTETATFERSRHFLGEVQATRSSMLGFEVSGALSEVRVDEGDAVAAGEVLATLDTRRLEAARTEAVAGLEEAMAAEELARSTLVRLERARVSNAVSAQQVDEAARQVDRQAAAAARARAQVERLDVDLAKSRLLAPYAGRLQRRLADEGTVLPAGQPVFELRETGVPEIRFSVEAELAQRVKPDMTFAAQARNATTLNLRVVRILPGRDPGTRAVPVFAQPIEGGENLREGELVEVVISETESQIGFWVPLTALAESARGLWSCYVAEPTADGGLHRLARREVEILSLQEERAYVIGNLHDGEALVLDGLHRIVPGQTVRLAEQSS